LEEEDNMNNVSLNLPSPKERVTKKKALKSFSFGEGFRMRQRTR
jgi:hypothetical protein